jgi:hypothetical protein
VADLQTNIGGAFPFYRVRIPGVVAHAQEMSQRPVHLRTAEETKEERRPVDAEEAAEQKAAEVPAPSQVGRRAYNREYMRQWRKRNQAQYREYNREYQRKRHMEKKVDRILNAPADHRKLCGYGCGRPAVETIERIDPRTWKTVRVAYCGHC